MIEKYEFNGKTKEEAVLKAIDELKIKESDIYILKEETESKIFKGKKVTINIIKKVDIQNFIKEYIQNLSKKMNIEIKAEIREKDEVYQIMLISDNNAILIGKDGKTLNSIQILLRQALFIQTNMPIKILVDASFYKVKKQDHLENEIKKVLKDVSDSHVSVTLDPMNSYDRRIVHTLASEFENIKTESIGEGKDRRVVISYIEK